MCPPCCRWCFASTYLPLQQLVAVSLGLCLPVSGSVSPWVCLPAAGCFCLLLPPKLVFQVYEIFVTTLVLHFSNISLAVDVNPRPTCPKNVTYPTGYPFLRMTVTSMFYAGVCCLGCTAKLFPTFSGLME